MADTKKIFAELAFKIKGDKEAEKSLGKIEKELKKTEKTTNKLTKGSKALAKSVVGVVAAYASFRVMREAVELSNQQERAVTKLSVSLQKTTLFAEEFSAVFQRQAKELQKTTIFSDQEVLNAQAILNSMGVLPERIQDALTLATRLSVVFDRDLANTAELIGRSIQLQARELAQLIPELTNLTQRELRAGKQIDIGLQSPAISKAFGETRFGELQQIKNQFREIGETLGDLVKQLITAEGAAGGLSDALAVVAESFSRIVALETSFGAISNKATEFATALIKIVNITSPGLVSLSALAATKVGQILPDAEISNRIETLRDTLNRVKGLNEDNLSIDDLLGIDFTDASQKDIERIRVITANLLLAGGDLEELFKLRDKVTSQVSKNKITEASSIFGELIFGEFTPVGVNLFTDVFKRLKEFNKNIPKRDQRVGLDTGILLRQAQFENQIIAKQFEQVKLREQLILQATQEQEALDTQITGRKNLNSLISKTIEVNKTNLALAKVGADLDIAAIENLLTARQTQLDTLLDPDIGGRDPSSSQTIPQVEQQVKELEILLGLSEKDRKLKIDQAQLEAKKLIRELVGIYSAGAQDIAKIHADILDLEGRPFEADRMRIRAEIDASGLNQGFNRADAIQAGFTEEQISNFEKAIASIAKILNLKLLQVDADEKIFKLESLLLGVEQNRANAELDRELGLQTVKELTSVILEENRQLLDIQKELNLAKVGELELWNQIELQVKDNKVAIQNLNRENIELFESVTKGPLRTLFNDLIDQTKSLSQTFNDLIDNLADKIQDRLIDDALESLFNAIAGNAAGKSGGNSLAGIISFLGAIIGGLFGAPGLGASVGGAAGGGIPRNDIIDTALIDMPNAPTSPGVIQSRTPQDRQKDDGAREVTIINLTDSRNLGQYLSTSEGKATLVNIITQEAPRVRRGLSLQ